MKKILITCLCFMLFIGGVNAESYKVDLRDLSDNHTYRAGDTIDITVYLKDFNSVPEGGLNSINASLVYDKNVFELTSKTSDILPADGWGIYVKEENPTYGLEGHTYTDPTTGIKYLLSTTTNPITTAQYNGVIAQKIYFKIKENTPEGTYIIAVNPTYNDDQVTYEDVIDITVVKDILHRCVIDAYNTKNSASKAYTETLTAEEAATITQLQCLSSPENTATIGDLTDLKALVNLEELNIGRIAVKAIDLKENVKLKNLQLDTMPGDVTINLASNVLLENLGLVGDFTSLDLTKNTRLTELWLTTEITSLDLTQNTELVDVTLITPLTSLDLTKNTKLENLSIHNTSLALLDLTKNTKLKADKLIIEDGSLIKSVTVKLNESIALPHIVQLPSHLSVTRTVIHSGNYADIENNKIIGKKVSPNSTATGELVSVDYYVDDTHFFTETFRVNVTNVSNPKTGVFDVSAFIIIIALLSYFLYRNVKSRKQQMSLQ